MKTKNDRPAELLSLISEYKRNRSESVELWKSVPELSIDTDADRVKESNQLAAEMKRMRGQIKNFCDKQGISFNAVEQEINS